MKNSRGKIFVAGLIAVVICAFYFGYQYFKSPDEMQDMVADLSVNAYKIVSDYSQNELQSDSIYLGKIIDINGMVAQVKSAGKDGLTIYFEPFESMGSLAVLMSDKSADDKYPIQGDSILVRAFCTGYLMDVMCNRGVIIKRY
jgi:hypothetical protein